MNGIEKITDRIAAEATAVADAILSQGEALAAKLRADYEKKARDTYDELLRTGTDEVEQDVVERSDGVFEVDGDLPIGDFAELVEMKERDFGSDSATIGGWTIEKFGAFPAPGDEVEAQGLRIRVLAMDEDGRRVEKLLAEKTGD